MGDKLLINGVTYQGRGEILSWDITPLASGIKVQWSPTDIQIISGTSWTITSGVDYARTSEIFYSPPINASFSCVNNISNASLTLPAPNRRFRMKILRPDTGAVWDTTSLSLLGDRPQIQWSNFVLQGCSNSTQNRTRGRILRPDNVVRTTTSTTNPSASIGWFPIFVEEQYSVWVRVESDIGDYSLRETTNYPSVSLLTGSVGLVVNYADGSQSPLMEFPQNPTVSELNDALCPQACNLSNQILSKLGG